jgi:hypothetical protein
MKIRVLVPFMCLKPWARWPTFSALEACHNGPSLQRRSSAYSTICPVSGSNALPWSAQCGQKRSGFAACDGASTVTGSGFSSGGGTMNMARGTTSTGCFLRSCRGMSVGVRRLVCGAVGYWERPCIRQGVPGVSWMAQASPVWARRVVARWEALRELLGARRVLDLSAPSELVQGTQLLWVLG